MRGTVTKKRNRWYICYYAGKLPNGKWKQNWEGSWETKKEAEKVLRSRISEIEDSFERKAENCSLKVYLENWLNTYCKEHLASNSIRGYSVNVKNHIIPYIGSIRLNQLRPADIQNLYSTLLSEGLASTTVRYVHNNLRRALAVAVKMQLIPKNPADFVEAPVVNHYDAYTLDADGVRRLLDACKANEIYMPVLLAVTLGLRRGEALGLQWDDVNWTQRTISINRTATFTKDGISLGTTKTRSSRRTLLLPDGVYDVLKHEYAEQLERKQLFGESFNSLHLICCRQDGSPLSSNVLWHDFSIILEKNGFEHMRFHDLRHTNATLMLRNAVPSKIVSSMLGHSSIGITLDIYSHVMTDMQQEAVGIMDEILQKQC